MKNQSRMFASAGRQPALYRGTARATGWGRDQRTVRTRIYVDRILHQEQDAYNTNDRQIMQAAAMRDRKPIETLADALLTAEEEVGHLMKEKLSAFLADSKGLSQRGKQALIDVYVSETRRAVVDTYVRAFQQASERIIGEKLPSGSRTNRAAGGSSQRDR